MNVVITQNSNFLCRVATCAAVQMPISNLAKIFGPTVVGYSKKEPDYAAILGETAIQQNVSINTFGNLFKNDKYFTVDLVLFYQFFR